MNDSHIPKIVMGESFGGRSPMGKPTSRGKDVAWRKCHNLLQVWNWKATMRKRESWRKKTGETMA